MLKPGGTGGDQFEIDANGNIVPRKSSPKFYYTTEWVDGKPHQVSHAAGPAATPPVWDAAAQAADDAASAQWNAYRSSIPSYAPPTAAATPQTPNPTVNTSSTLLNGTTPTTPPQAAPQPHALLGQNAMARQLSPQTMVQMKSPLQNGLFGKPLWKGGFKGSFNL